MSNRLRPSPQAPHAYTLTPGHTEPPLRATGPLRRPAPAPAGNLRGAFPYGDGPPDPRLRPGSNTCLCTTCGEYLNSVAAFDKHRRAGRCLTPLQMLADGMSKNERGLWITEAYVPGSHRQEENTP